MLVLISALILINIQLIDGFCRLYENNDYNVLVHSPDNKNLLLVVEGFYWLVNESSDNELQFVSSEFYGESNVLTNISTLFSVGLTQTLVENGNKITNVTNFVGFHEKSSREDMPFGLIAFVADQKRPVIPICYKQEYQINYEGWSVSKDNNYCGDYISYDSERAIQWDAWRTKNVSVNIPQTISFRYKTKWINGQNVGAFNAFFEQSVSGQSKQFSRRIHVIDIQYDFKELNDNTYNYILQFIVRLKRDDKVITDHLFIEQIGASVEVLGFLQTRPDNETHKILYVLLRTYDDKQIDGRLAIKYCVYSPTIPVNECFEKKYKLLIDCSQPIVNRTVVADPTTKPKDYSFPLILYLIIGAIVFWLLFVVICIIYYFCSKSKKESEQVTQSSSELQSSIIKSEGKKSSPRSPISSLEKTSSPK